MEVKNFFEVKTVLEKNKRTANWDLNAWVDMAEEWARSVGEFGNETFCFEDHSGEISFDLVTPAEYAFDEDGDIVGEITEAVYEINSVYVYDFGKKNRELVF